MKQVKRWSPISYGKASRARPLIEEERLYPLKAYQSTYEEIAFSELTKKFPEEEGDE